MSDLYVKRVEIKAAFDPIAGFVQGPDFDSSKSTSVVSRQDSEGAQRSLTDLSNQLKAALKRAEWHEYRDMFTDEFHWDYEAAFSLGRVVFDQGLTDDTSELFENAPVADLFLLLIYAAPDSRLRKSYRVDYLVAVPSEFDANSMLVLSAEDSKGILDTLESLLGA